MARRGRRPVPRELKILRGTLRPSRDRGGPLGEPLTKLPRAPRSLSEAGRKYWRRLGRRLVEVRVLTELDLPVFEQLCDTLGRLDEVREQLNRLPPPERYTLRSHGGRTHPLLKILHQLQGEALRLASEFGLTPASRPRVPASEQGSDAALDELLGLN